MGDNSISIVRHNYSKELTYLEKRSGIYNVSMVIFKNDERAMACLKWWRERCLEWCYAYYENGKLGDQMYLDDWTTRFTGVHVVKHKGVNLAPWNLNKYCISEKDGRIMIDEDPLIYYHYHSFKMYGASAFQLYYSSYLISAHDEKNIYPPYVTKIKELIAQMKSDYPDFNYGFDKYPGLLVRIKQTLKKLFSFWFFYKSLKK
jgi:hypothetical protein